MKSAEEWIKLFEYCEHEGEHQTEEMRIEAIQLDAFKAGMTRASEIADLACHIDTTMEQLRIKLAILSARDNTTLETLCQKIPQ